MHTAGSDIGNCSVSDIKHIILWEIPILFSEKFTYNPESVWFVQRHTHTHTHTHMHAHTHVKTHNMHSKHRHTPLSSNPGFLSQWQALCSNESSSLSFISLPCQLLIPANFQRESRGGRRCKEELALLFFFDICFFWIIPFLENEMVLLPAKCQFHNIPWLVFVVW